HMAAIVLRGSVSADELEDDPVEAGRLIAGRRVAGVGHDHEARALARDSARRRARGPEAGEAVDQCERSDRAGAWNASASPTQAPSERPATCTGGSPSSTRSRST